jgi:hypothetical protein
MWTYTQSTGNLLDASGTFVGTGYSGAPSGKNNPAKQCVADVGPIPRGLYTIGAPQNTATHGPYALPLTPDPANHMCGRSGFLIHGDSIQNPGVASTGCIILAKTYRTQNWTSGDHQLQVVQ